MPRSRPTSPFRAPTRRERTLWAWLVRCLVLVLAGTTVFTISSAALAQEKVVLAESLEVRGMDCVPQVTQVETRRPIPFMCQTDKEVAGVELRYRFEGAGTKWEKLEFKQSEAGWTGTIPCGGTSHAGNLKVYIFARNEDSKVVARIGRKTAPMVIKLVESSELPPPALPNKEPPDRCFAKSECPAEMIGTAACPGTSKGKGTKGGWGAGCAETSQCQEGLECVSGACETPPKCESPEDCPSGGECTDGVCRYPTKEELENRLGPPKLHWVGLHLGVDFASVREATGVCGAETEDSKDYACYRGGNVYTGIPNDVNSGAVPSGLHFATVRALLSYDLFLKRFLFGGRVGWAFRGSPKDFSPIHVEARALYSLRKGPENNRFRPYLGLAGGYAQVDVAVETEILDCVAPPGVTDPVLIETAVNDCKDDRTKAEIDAKKATGAAVTRPMDAYRQGGSIFFGPTFSIMYLFSNESALVFNFNVMFPDVVFQPSLGYAMGIRGDGSPGRATMSRLRYLWLAVPALAIAELVLHVVFSRRAPRVEEWRELSEPVRRLKRSSDLLVVAPEWAEPIARHAFGDGAFPLDQIARADASTFARALEVSALDERANETLAWRVVSEERRGRFTLRVLENPAPIRPKFRFIEHVAPTLLAVSIVTDERETPCPFTDRAAVTAGGLHGHVTFPRERFRCPGGESSFVGVTVIDDQKYLPRRCIWAHPPGRGSLRLRFAGVPLGSKIRGWAGLSYFLFRDGVGDPVSISFHADGRPLGEHQHRDEWGFRAFSLVTSGFGDRTTDVDVIVRAGSAANRDFCFVAETL